MKLLRSVHWQAIPYRWATQCHSCLFPDLFMKHSLCRVDDWKIDLSSRPLLACDPHGWHYAFNFSLMPFRGRTHALHPLPCVRRRRWIRTRVLEAWGPVTADMQRHLVPSKRAVCPTRLGSSSTSSTPRSHSPDTAHAETGLNGTALWRIGSDDGHTYRRHASTDVATRSSHSELLAAGHGASRSTPVSGLPSPELFVAAVEPTRSVDNPCGPASSADMHSRVPSGGTEMGELGLGSSDRLRGGQSCSSGGVNGLLSPRRRTASTPAGIFSRGRVVPGDVSPTSVVSPGKPLSVPSLSLTSLAAAKRSSAQGDWGSKGVRNLGQQEHASADLLRMYSERMYGSNVS